MIAVDTNVLVYAHRRDSRWFAAASARLREVAERRTPWAIPWPCVHEFLAIVTNPKIYRPPTPIQAALRQIEYWMESPGLSFIAETEDHLARLTEMSIAGKISGGAVHDARVAAICVEHGVSELWTLDRDFSRFPGLRCVNPMSI